MLTISSIRSLYRNIIVGAVVMLLFSIISALNAEEFIKSATLEYRYLEEGSGRNAVLGNEIKITYYDCDDQGNLLSEKAQASYILGLDEGYNKWNQLLLNMKPGDAILIRPNDNDEYLYLKLEKIMGVTQEEAYDIIGKTRIRTDSGLQYIIISEGDGSKAAPGYTVQFHYTMYLEDMTMITSSYAYDEPVEVVLGLEPIILGWFEGLTKMRQGDKGRLIIPPELSYSDEHWPEGVPHGETLVFDIDMLRVY